jgi:HK97 family phage major capsid protein
MAVGRYLDRLNEQYTEIHGGIETLVDRAADENRDVTPEEQAQVDRDQARLDELGRSIAHYSALEDSAAKVGQLRGATARAPQVTRTKVTEPEYSIAREFPTAGHYAATVHRARMDRDPAAIAAIGRLVEHLERDTTTKHQTTADNPGIIPRPILGPVISDIDSVRPFITSVGSRPLPAGQFDRPTVTQHVAIGKQAAEKDRTESQKMLIGKLPVAAATYAGHVNISRQDIKWSNPQILTIIYQDFADVYAQETDADAAELFWASVTNTVALTALDGAALYSAIYAAAAANITPGKGNTLPDTLWVAPDVWGGLGGLLSPMGTPLFPSLSPGDTQGNMMGLNIVVDANFTLSEMVLGPSRFAEWYEDLDGLMSVGEPDVLGQLVGYAGYGAFLNTRPEVFTKMTAPIPPPPLNGRSSAEAPAPAKTPAASAKS